MTVSRGWPLRCSKLRSKKTDRKRLTQILEDSKRFGEESLLREEIDELLTAN